MKKFVAANWKMNGDPEFMKDFFENFSLPDDIVETIFAVPYPLILEAKKYNIKIAAQNCHHEDKGAFTGEVSADLLAKIGVKYVILGHSERREYNQEIDLVINKKVKAAQRNGLTPIICVGESDAQRVNGSYLEVIKNQILSSIPANISDDFIIAYEPIWAIGTGKIPTNNDIAEILNLIQETLSEFSELEDKSKVRILYGGSANAANCASLATIKNLSGYLVGSASLKPQDFKIIIQSLK